MLTWWVVVKFEAICRVDAGNFFSFIYMAHYFFYKGFLFTLRNVK